MIVAIYGAVITRAFQEDQLLGACQVLGTACHSRAESDTTQCTALLTYQYGSRNLVGK